MTSTVVRAQATLYKVTYGMNISHSRPNDTGEDESGSGSYFSDQGYKLFELGSTLPLFDSLAIAFTPTGRDLEIDMAADAGGNLRYDANSIWFSNSAVSMTVDTYVLLPETSTVQFSRRTASDTSLLSDLSGNHLAQASFQLDNNLYQVHTLGDLLFSDQVGPLSRSLTTPALLHNGHIYYRADESSMSMSLEAYTTSSTSGTVIYSGRAHMNLSVNPRVVPEPATIALSGSCVLLALLRMRRRITDK